MYTKNIEATLKMLLRASFSRKLFLSAQTPLALQQALLYYSGRHLLSVEKTFSQTLLSQFTLAPFPLLLYIESLKLEDIPREIRKKM